VEAEFRYHPSADQLSLAGTIDESLTDILPLARLHASQTEPVDVWGQLEEIGIFGISVSEEQGGSGLGAAEEALIAIGLGQRLAAPAVLATIGASHASDSAALHGRRVAAGYRHGARNIIVTDPATDLVLLRDQDSAALYESGSIESTILDGYLWHAELRAAARLGEPLARFDAQAMLRLRLIDAAALAGIARAAQDMGVAYAGIREQFGRPIGSFQAVKHHCANMAMAARCARDQVSFAAIAVDDRREDAALQVESALFIAGSAALDNAGKNIQIHGGIGFSDEADPHLLLKHAHLLIAIAGGLEAANKRIANVKAGW
jgi:alkylation response protein AidB-like acyl-CoA dehydrogenase